MLRGACRNVTDWHAATAYVTRSVSKHDRLKCSDGVCREERVERWQTDMQWQRMLQWHGSVTRMCHWVQVTLTSVCMPKKMVNLGCWNLNVAFTWISWIVFHLAAFANWSIPKQLLTICLTSWSQNLNLQATCSSVPNWDTLCDWGLSELCGPKFGL
jgi:hypothetical protein